MFHMLCGQNHLASECPVKDKPEKHVYANCLTNFSLRSKANDHRCSDYACPAAIKKGKLKCL